MKNDENYILGEYIWDTLSNFSCSSDCSTDHRQRKNTSDSSMVHVKREKVKMKKNIGLISGISIVLGSIIGSGIFISPKSVLIETGSVGLSLIVWLSSGILAIIGSLCYSELGCLIPKSGGEYPYLLAGLGRIVAFLFAWTQSVVLTPASVAICTLTFAEYMVTLFDHCGTSRTLVKLIAALLTITLSIINCWDTRLSTNVLVLFTAAKLIAISIIIFGGFVWLGRGETGTLRQGFTGTTDSASSIALAFYDASWAYEGWNKLNCVMEELKNPYVNLPRANILGVTIATVVYLLVNMSYLTVLGTDGLLKSSAVASTWGETVLGSAWIIMPIAVLLAIIGSVNGTLFAGSRILYSAAREQQFPEVLSYVSYKRYTPIPCITLTAMLALLYISIGNIGNLINFFSFAAWLFYGLTTLVLVVLRFTMKDKHRPIKVFILFPIVFMVCSAYLVVVPIVQDPTIEFLFAFLFMIGGLVFYIPYAHFHIDNGCCKSITSVIQYLMEVVPSPYDPDDI